MVRAVYLVGERVTVAFSTPVEDQVPDGWRAEIKPPIPGIACPGNLVLQMFRTKGDIAEIATIDDFNQETRLDKRV